MKMQMETGPEGWRQQGMAFAEAVLIKTQYSSPRMPGARLWVNAEGRMAGGISMGCVESDLREHLLNLLRGEGTARKIHYGHAFAESLEVGLSCGGEMDVWIRKAPPQAPAAPTGRSVYVLRLAEGGAEGYWREGEAVPAGGAGLEGALEKIWRGGGTWCGRAADGGEWFLEVKEAEPRLWVVGASPIAISLCALAARSGWRVTVVDPRREFARSELFPDAAEVIHRWPQEGMPEGGLAADDAVAVLAHDAKLDVPALETALRAGCRYIGLLGSPPTQADRMAMLLADGFSEADCARIRGPIGLKSLGGVEPAEIAISILAQLIQWRHGKAAKEHCNEPPV